MTTANPSKDPADKPPAQKDTGEPLTFTTVGGDPFLPPERLTEDFLLLLALVESLHAGTQ